MPNSRAAKLVFVQGPLVPIPEKHILHGTNNTLLALWRCAQWTSELHFLLTGLGLPGSS